MIFQTRIIFVELSGPGGLIFPLGPVCPDGPSGPDGAFGTCGPCVRLFVNGRRLLITNG